MSINLGAIVRDKVTGYQGLVIGITNYLHEPSRAIVQAQETYEGRPVEPQFIAASQLEIVETAA